MQITKINYKFKRGDTKNLNAFKLQDREGKDLVLSENDKIYFTMKPMEEDIAIIKKSIGNGIELGEDGFYHLQLQPEDTEELLADKYRYDIELNLDLEKLYVKTIIEGSITLDQDITEKEDR